MSPPGSDTQLDRLLAESGRASGGKPYISAQRIRRSGASSSPRLAVITRFPLISRP